MKPQTTPILTQEEGDQLEKIARIIAIQFQQEGDWPWEYIYGELKHVYAIGYDAGFTKGNYNVPI